MKANVIRIGNSRGIRIPKALLKQCRLDGEVEIQSRKNELVIRSLAAPRSGWNEAFTRMAGKGDDSLFDEKSWTSSKWDNTEWEW